MSNEAIAEVVDYETKAKTFEEENEKLKQSLTEVSLKVWNFILI